MTDLPNDMERELAGLADGSLTAQQREHALERVRGSRELQAALVEQQRSVELTSAVEVRAPASLHRRVEGMIPSAHVRRTRAIPRVGLAAATAAVLLAAAAIAVGLSEGGSKGSSELGAQQTAALALSPATRPAPVENRKHRTQLAVSVDGVAFPYWEERFGWRSSGARSDKLAGRSVETVFYTNATGKRIGYAIVSGAAPTVADGTIVRRWGVTYRLLTHNGASVVTWERGGHLCVVTGHAVSSQTLLRLAGWGGERRVAS